MTKFFGPDFESQFKFWSTDQNLNENYVIGLTIGILHCFGPCKNLISLLLVRWSLLYYNWSLYEASSFSWRVKVVKCQGGQVSKTGFRDIGSTGSPKKGLHNVLGHEPLVFSLTVNLSENGLLTTCCFGYLTTDCPQILMTLALTVTWVTFSYLVPFYLLLLFAKFYLSFMSILCRKTLVKLKSCPHDLSTYKYLNINTCPFEI